VRDNEGNKIITITKHSAMKKDFDTKKIGETRLDDIEVVKEEKTEQEEEHDDISFNLNIYHIGYANTWGCCSVH